MLEEGAATRRDTPFPGEASEGIHRFPAKGGEGKHRPQPAEGTVLSMISPDQASRPERSNKARVRLTALGLASFLATSP